MANGTEPITVSLKSDLVEILDYLCGQRDINRSAAMCEAVKLWCARELSKSPEFWTRAVYGVRNRSQKQSIV